MKVYSANFLHWDKGFREGFMCSLIAPPNSGGIFRNIEELFGEENGKGMIVARLEFLWPSERRTLFAAPNAVDRLIRAGVGARMAELQEELAQFDHAQKAIHTMLEDRSASLPNAAEEITALWNGVADGSYRSYRSPQDEAFAVLTRSEASRWADPNLIATTIKSGKPEVCLTVIKQMEPSIQLIMLAAPPLLEYLFHGQPKATAELIAGLKDGNPQRPENAAGGIPLGHGL
jgi:hypothetical protein